jgi:hypothetical protein
MTHAIRPERLVLFCPRCGAQHEDLGEWAERPHRTHRCLFCENEWRPFPWTTVGVAMPPLEFAAWPAVLVREATFQRLADYSASLPTGPSPWRFWRSRWPYRSMDREALWHHLGVTVPMPDDPPGEITIVWRRLLVAEWLVGDTLCRALPRCSMTDPKPITELPYGSPDARRVLELERRVAELESELVRLKMQERRLESFLVWKERVAAALGMQLDMRADDILSSLETELAALRETRELERRRDAWLDWRERNATEVHMISAACHTVMLCEIMCQPIQGEGPDYWQALRAALDAAEAEKGRN